MGRNGWAESVDWQALYAQRLLCEAQRADVIQRFREVAQTACEEFTSTVSDQTLHRVWRCVEYHWRALAQPAATDFATAIQRIQSGRLSYGVVPANVVADVALADALERHETLAAEKFDREFMPIIRRIAQRFGGTQGVSVVENFAAELLMPRSGNAPKIASFQGKTPLAFWLRTVVLNYLRNQARQPRFASLDEHNSGAATGSDSSWGDCEDLLQPVFQRSVGELAPQDRVLLKMVILDGAPQVELANAFGLHPGTLTRRRQNAERSIWLQVQQMISQSNGRSRMRECLDSLLSGGSRELRRVLADLMAGAIRGDDPQQEQQS